MSSGQSGNWRPIDTAPTDGTPVIVACRRAPDMPTAWVIGEARMVYGSFAREWYWAGNDPTDSWGGSIQPELWQPMPEAPKS